MTARPDVGQSANRIAAGPVTAPAWADQLDGANIGLTKVQPTSRQNRSALATVAVLIVAVAGAAPYAATPLPRFAAFIPFLNAAIVVTDLVTAILLFAQFSMSRSRALLVLAGGYLFTAMIVIPHALTFPGAFSPTGLLGAGPQTAAWLYISWHLGFPMSLFLYAGLKDEERTVVASLSSSVGWCVAITISLVLGLVWLTTAGDPFLPRLFLNASELTPLGAYVPAFDLAICAVALAFMWKRRSVAHGCSLRVDRRTGAYRRSLQSGLLCQPSTLARHLDNRIGHTACGDDGIVHAPCACKHDAAA